MDFALWTDRRPLRPEALPRVGPTCTRATAGKDDTAEASSTEGEGAAEAKAVERGTRSRDRKRTTVADDGPRGEGDPSLTFAHILTRQLPWPESSINWAGVRLRGTGHRTAVTCSHPPAATPRRPEPSA